jgi:hypothetical protein
MGMRFINGRAGRIAVQFVDHQGKRLGVVSLTQQQSEAFKKRSPPVHAAANRGGNAR